MQTRFAIFFTAILFATVVFAQDLGSVLSASDNPPPGQGTRPDGGQPPKPRPKNEPLLNQPIGLLLNTDKACPGYTLFAPKHHTITYLMDNDGRIVHSWKSDYEPGQSAYLLENGDLLRAAFIGPRGNKTFGGGDGGRVERFNWNGNLVWEYNLSTDTQFSHHDIKPLPNGNILLIVWEFKSYQEAVANGRDPKLLPDGKLWPDSILEIKPVGKNGAEVVWAWRVWDHMIQDYDRTKANYGKVGEHPELIDINFWAETGSPAHANWNHMNSLDYNPELDQIMLSVRGFSEFWVIDHSTTTKEAAGHTGGRGGKGGDLVYRWGNPQAYRAGTAKDQQLFQQHDAQWIKSGLPGAGNILIYNNGISRPDGSYSTVDEIVPAMDASGKYASKGGSAFGPEKQVWIYKARNPADFYSAEISGAQRLQSGNTLICNGVNGVFFEVAPNGEIVWEYVNPVVASGPLRQGESIPMDDRGHPMNAVFKIRRYAPDYPGLKGRDLAPGKPLVDPPSVPAQAVSAGANATGALSAASTGAPSGAPAPVNLLRLPDTGQTGDFTTTFGEDSDFSINPMSFRDNGDGTVTDLVTGLMWQQTDGPEMTWEKAVEYARDLTLGGYHDWRLPNTHELLGLVDYGAFNPALTQAFFPDRGLITGGRGWRWPETLPGSGS